MKPTMLLLLSLVACATTRTPLPEHLRPEWDRCDEAITRHCHEHSHGDPSAERRCVQHASDEYAAAGDVTPLRQAGCPAPPPAN